MSVFFNKIKLNTPFQSETLKFKPESSYFQIKISGFILFYHYAKKNYLPKHRVLISGFFAADTSEVKINTIRLSVNSKEKLMCRKNLVVLFFNKLDLGNQKAHLRYLSYKYRLGMEDITKLFT
jgi:hypothetical protein